MTDCFNNLLSGAILTRWLTYSFSDLDQGLDPVLVWRGLTSPEQWQVGSKEALGELCAGTLAGQRVLAGDALGFDWAQRLAKPSVRAALAALLCYHYGDSADDWRKVGMSPGEQAAFAGTEPSDLYDWVQAH